jgi:hypothetical protein
MKTPEEWRPIPGFPRYEVSSLGRVLSNVRHPKIMKPVHVPQVSGVGGVVKKKGYLSVPLRHEGKTKRFLVHILVLLAFRGPCPPGKMACHWDDDGFNNCLDNLRWDTHAGNRNDWHRNQGRQVGLWLHSWPA